MTARRNIIIEIISFTFILLFIYTATSKILEHDSFRVVLSMSPLISTKANFISWSIPVIEIFIALGILIPLTRRTGFLAAAILMAIFTGYIGYMILFTPHLPCSCGGVVKQLSWKEHFVFNVALTALAFTGYKLLNDKKNIVATNRLSRTPV